MRTTDIHHTLSFLRQIVSTILLGITLSATAAPRLTVVVMVDGLNQENLELMRPYWTQGGLRTMSEEAYQNTCSFPHPVYGGNETTASFVTGTTPLNNGYAMDSYFLRKDRKVHELLEDNQSTGIGCEQKLSPRAILSTTITDQLRMQYGEKAKIYAVGISPATTILLAGHAANACCWINPITQRWATTSFYAEGLPAAADKQNISGIFEQTCAIHWQPQMDLPTYNYLAVSEQKNGFNYLVKDHLCQTPMANTLVIHLALDILQSEQMGKDDTPDMLLLELNTITPAATTDCIRSAEQEDNYLRLNQDLGYLMNQLNKQLSASDYEILLMGRPVLGINKTAFEQANIPIRPLDNDRITALSSTYLMALYGHERWIDGGYGQAIFLNHTLIEQKRLSLETMQRQLANFLMEFEGIQVAWPQCDILLNTQLSGISKKSIGDVYFTILPGWQLMQDEQHILDHVLDSNPTVPVMLWSNSLRHLSQEPLLSTQIIQLIH